MWTNKLWNVVAFTNCDRNGYSSKRPIPEAPMPAITMFRMSLPGRSRSSDRPIFNASPNWRVKPSIDFLVVDIIVNS